MGLRLEWPLGGKWRIGVSSGPGWYSGNRALDLGSHLEFRSSLYLMRRIGNRCQWGVSISRYSNGGTVEHNPGAETVRFLIAIPLRRR